MRLHQQKQLAINDVGMPTIQALAAAPPGVAFEARGAARALHRAHRCTSDVALTWRTPPGGAVRA
jgi:hypothetical protein